MENDLKEKIELNKERNISKVSNFQKGIMFFVIFFVLTLAITLQINTVSNSGKVGITPQENKLRDMLLKDKENYTKLEEIELKREETLDRLREDATKNDKKAKDTKEKLNDINKKLRISRNIRSRGYSYS